LKRKTAAHKSRGFGLSQLARCLNVLALNPRLQLTLAAPSEEEAVRKGDVAKSTQIHKSH
jgi:hypothetical protein